jgi:hypothetical protein
LGEKYDRFEKQLIEMRKEIDEVRYIYIYNFMGVKLGDLVITKVLKGYI